MLKLYGPAMSVSTGKASSLDCCHQSCATRSIHTSSRVCRPLNADLYSNPHEADHSILYSSEGYHFGRMRREKIAVPDSMPILHVCKAMRAETLTIYYGENLFTVDLTAKQKHKTLQWLKSLDEEAAHSIRRIEIQAETKCEACPFQLWTSRKPVVLVMAKTTFDHLPGALFSPQITCIPCPYCGWQLPDSAFRSWYVKGQTELDEMHGVPSTQLLRNMCASLPQELHRGYWRRHWRSNCKVGMIQFTSMMVLGPGLGPRARLGLVLAYFFGFVLFFPSFCFFLFSVARKKSEAGDGDGN